MKLVRLEVKGYKGLDFEQDLPDDNKLIITGVNGSGKTTLLEAVEILLSNRVSVSEEIARRITSDSAKFSATVMTSEDEISALAEEIASRIDFSYDQILNVLKTKIFDKNLEYRKTMIVGAVTPDKRWAVDTEVNITEGGLELEQGLENAFKSLVVLRLGTLRNINPPHINEVSVTLDLNSLFGEERDVGQSRLSSDLNMQNYVNFMLRYRPEQDGLEDIKKLLDKYSELLSPIRIFQDESGSPGRTVVKAAKGSKSFELTSLSAGQKQAINLVTLFDAWSKLKIKPIILLDEPEAGLHPGLVRRLFDIFNDKIDDSSGTNFTYIVATHSSEVVSSNAEHVYRIITIESGSAELVKISNLQERAEILTELGVHLHIDYVAQKLVFVESTRVKQSGLNDSEIYQILIDPTKEKVLFSNVPAGGGSKQSVKTFVEEFRDELLKKLGGTGGTILSLTDRDGDNYKLGSNTPFKHIEYLFLVCPEIAVEKLNLYSGEKLTLADFNKCVSSTDKTFERSPLEADSKAIWKNVLSKWGISASAKYKNRIHVERAIASSIGKLDELPKEIAAFVGHYRQ